MLEEYLKADEKAFGYFFALVVGTAIVVTGVYWAIFGFDRWEVEMDRATELMAAAAVAPFGQVNTVPSGTGQYICPRDGAAGLPNFDASGIAHCPICGQAMAFQGTPATNINVAAGTW